MELCPQHDMALEVVCFDCVGKLCYRCVYEEHQGHRTAPLEEFVDKVEQDKAALQKVISQLEKKEQFLKSQIVEEVFKPQRNKKTLEFK